MFVNQPVCDIYGDDIIKKKCYEVIKRQDQSCDFCPIKDFLKSNACQVRFEQCLLLPYDERTNYYDVISSPIINYDGKPAILELLRDVTERKKMEEALKESEKKYRLITENIHDLITVVNQEFKVDYLNVETHKRILGTVNEDKKSVTKLDQIHPDDLEKIIKLMKLCFETKKMLTSTIRLKHQNGNYLWFDVNAKSFIDDKGKKKIIAISRNITERNKAEQKLKESEEKYRHLFEKSPYMIMLMNLEGKIIDFNTATIENSGYQKEDLIGRDFRKLNLYHPEYLQPVVEQFKGLLKKGSMEPIEFQAYKKNGDLTWLKLNASIMQMEKKSVIQIIMEDVNEKKVAENALRKSESSLANAQRISHLGNWDWDIINNDLYWSDEIYRIFGLTPQEFGATYESFMNSVHLDDREFVKTSIEKALNEKKPYNIEHRIILPDGSVRIVNEQAEVIFDENGNALKMIGIVQDITSLKQSEQELRRSEQTLHEMNSLIENAPMAILLIHQSGKILRVNEQAINLFKYRDDEILGFNIFDLFGPESLKLAKSHYTSDIYELSRSNKIETLVKTKKNEFIDVEITSNVIKIADNIIIQSFFSNISKRKKDEQNRQFLLDQLLTSLEFKSKFLATMSHELRTPLNAVVGFSELLLEESYGVLAETQREFLKDINSAGDHLLKLINSILDFSKLEAGKFTLNIKKFKLNIIMKEINSIILPFSSKKGLKYVVEGIKNEDHLTADPLRFKQIIYNLLSNAIKFTNTGSIKLRGIERGDHWEFQVKDTGIGIAKEDYDVVFREFGRVEQDKVKDVSGAGIGLALTKRLVQLHGGDIWFESEVGKGTTFYFTIPKKKIINKWNKI